MYDQGQQGKCLLKDDYPPLESHGIIGNMLTTALVTTYGKISFMCYPYFDSGAPFCYLLDSKKGGYWAITPVDGSEDFKTKQFYLPESNILVTRSLSDYGVGHMEDYMPVITQPHSTTLDLDADGYGWLVRRVAAVRGHLKYIMKCRPTFNFARDPHKVIKTATGVKFECINSKGDDLSLFLDCTVKLETEIDEKEGSVTCHFTLKEGDSLAFILRPARAICYAKKSQDQDHSYYFINAERIKKMEQKLFNCTVDFWRRWMEKCTYHGRWREMVSRSALVLKLLTFAPTGAIVASPTCSLPEEVGGERNWDYRFTWIRDAAFTLYGLMRIGFTEEAGAFMNWLERSILSNPESNGAEMPIQIMYTIHGGKTLKEEHLPHLEGYLKSSPVRVGNDAAGQMQLDIFGELMDSVYLYNKYGNQISYDFWCHLVRILNWLSTNWKKKDEGLWEVRSGRQHFVYSKVMCWVAFDRGLRLADRRSFPAPRGEWQKVRDEIYEEIMREGFNKEKNCFVMHYGSESLDASLLIMPLVFFVSPTDPRMVNTVKQILKTPREGGLVSNSLVFRYDITAAKDGLEGFEGTFNMCTFWLIEAMTRAGMKDKEMFARARLTFEEMLTYSNHLGLYSEEIGLAGQSLGNFPQAFTHLSLISSAFNLDRAMNGMRGLSNEP
jgi:GH15 family glucan-1,4-alpha-glucosidase